MSRRVELCPSGRTFAVHAHDTILEAALRNGVALEYGCANGTCGRCKARVVAGTVNRARFHDFVLSESEKRQGYALLCCVAPETDVRIEASEAGGAGDIAYQSIECRIHKLERTGSTLLLGVRTPRSRVLRFLAGQHVTLALARGDARDLSLANCPCDGMNLQFHLEPRPGDSFVAYLTEEARRGELVTVAGPAGEFTLQGGAGQGAMFVAGDTGFAPVRSLIEHAINLERPQALRLFWHVSGAPEPYLHNLCRTWEDGLDDFHYRWHAGAHSGAGLEAELGDWLTAHDTELHDLDFYLSGPRRFAARVAPILTGAAAGPDRLRTNALELGD